MSEKYLHEMIDDIEVLIDEAKPARFSPGKIMIEKDSIDDSDRGIKEADSR